jgi:NADPH-dependent curcumin reductase CurA
VPSQDVWALPVRPSEMTSRTNQPVAVPRINRAVTLASRPTGFPSEENFELVESPAPESGPGEVLVRVLWTSVDPYQRGRMSTRRSYAKPVEVGEVMTAQSVGEVVESNDRRFELGDLVVGTLGWQEYAVARAGTLRKLPDGMPPQMALHVLGTNGLTAYFGLLDVAQARAGDTVVVSGAAGAVGQVVGQLAKISGCRAVGIAGGPEKKADLLDFYGYDAAIDYKGEDVRAAPEAPLAGADSQDSQASPGSPSETTGRAARIVREGLKDACPDGVDVYFDNVGGEISAAVHARLNVGARIAICGQVSQYNLERPEPTFHPGLLVVYRARMEGFLIYDYAHRFGEALPRLAAWVAEGRIRYKEDVVDGIERAPEAFLRMLRGENQGKQLVRVAES